MISCSLLFLFVTLTTPVAAQPPEPPQPGADRPTAMAFLKHALEEAGATALSADQETQIQGLVDTMRESSASRQPDESLITALSAYRNAVVAGDMTGVKSAAATLALKEADNSRLRLEDQATWIIQILALLAPDQLNKLIARFEPDGTFQILQRLTLGGRGFPGAPGRGPMMGRRPRE